MSNHEEKQLASTQYARKSIRALIQHVYNNMGNELTGVTYQELAKRIDRLDKHGRGRGLGMGSVLGRMGRLLQDLEVKWGEPIPHIHSLVISKTGPLKGLPSEGIKEFWQDYPNLDKSEKLNKVRREYQRISEFGSRWDNLLEALDLERVIPDVEREKGTQCRGRGGGESPEHNALKMYVEANPALVGASADFTPFTEYVLPSLDTLDVLFKSSRCWIGVEVKSRVSDCNEQDYRRGIYQCVKYRAILNAMHRDPTYDVPSDIRVVLVLESKLPSSYEETAAVLGVKVYDQIRVLEGQT